MRAVVDVLKRPGNEDKFLSPVRLDPVVYPEMLLWSCAEKMGPMVDMAGGWVDGTFGSGCSCCGVVCFVDRI